VKKKPRFYCDNCGQEVGNDAKSCSHCGRFFASVRCPSCGYVGEDKLFIKGCPSCGYSDPSKKKNRKKLSVKPIPLMVYFISIIIILLFVVLLSYLITR